MSDNRLEEMEPPFTGLYYIFEAPGDYHCKNCKSHIFSSEDKFHSGSGWACFDKSTADSTTIKTTDSDNAGDLVFCANCSEFLGQYFEGEGFTQLDKRYNISSKKIKFTPLLKSKK